MLLLCGAVPGRQACASLARRAITPLVTLLFVASSVLPAAGAAEIELGWSTFLGGGNRDMGWGLTRGADGSVLVVGETLSLDFPTTPDAFDRWHNGVTDTYLARFAPDDGTLLYATVLGSANRDVCRDVAVDAAGNIYLAGSTNSPNFPVTPNAPDPNYNGGHDLYLAKFDPSGRELLCATYIGGSLNEKTRGMVLLGPDLVCVTGFTESPDFPVTPGCFDDTHNGDWDVFVVVVDLSGPGVVAGTYLGGLAEEEAWDLATDAGGNIYVTGYTNSVGFPTTLQSHDPGWNYRWDVFVTKLDSSLGELSYSTFIGGYGWDWGWRLVIDAYGAAYVAGQTSSENFPTTLGVYDPSPNGGDDAFVARLSPAGDELEFATVLGGRHADQAQALGVDPAGFVFVSGGTYSDDFPIVGDVPGPNYCGAGDLFFALLSPGCSHLIASSFLGGCEWEEAYAAHWDCGELFVAGVTQSPNFPAGGAGFDSTWNGESDAFVTRLDLATQYAGVRHDPVGPAADRALPAGQPRLALWPTPTLGDAQIRLHLPCADWVTVDLCDAAGRRLERLFAGSLAAGDHRLSWSGARSSACERGVAYLLLRSQRGRCALSVTRLR